MALRTGVMASMNAKASDSSTIAEAVAGLEHDFAVAVLAAQAQADGEIAHAHDSGAGGFVAN